jgi:Fe-S-cluster-containing hydrogenase component 2
MRVHNHHPLVTTSQEKCRACYTCVRECPAKAIRISSGQAEVLVERCIGCGNCFRVCSQGAKQVYDSMDEVRQVLAGGLPVSAMLAPSFPAAFSDIPHQTLVGMIRALGFETVHEVGFGADLVAGAYKKLMTDFPQGRFIATTCPALVAFKGMRKLILDLLDVTRLESGQKPRQMSGVDLVKTAALAVENMAGPAGERGITMEI